MRFVFNAQVGTTVWGSFVVIGKSGLGCQDISVSPQCLLPPRRAISVWSPRIPDKIVVGFRRFYSKLAFSGHGGHNERALLVFDLGKVF